MELSFALNNPNLLEFVIDTSGSILNVSSNIVRLACWESHEALGKKLTDLFYVIEPIDKNILESGFIFNNPECPDNCYIKSQHPNALREMNGNIFHFSYGDWRASIDKGHFLVSLAPQRFNSPISQWLMCLYRRLSQPMVLTHPDFTIQTYNSDFLTLLNFFDEAKIAGASLFSFIDPQYQHPNPFLNDGKIRYINSLAENPGSPWQKTFDLFTKSGLIQSLKGQFVLENVSTSRPGPDTLSLRPENETRTSFMVYSKAVNFPNQDLRIEFECSFEHGSEVTIGLGRPFSGGSSTLFDLGYQIELRFLDALFCQFYRRNALLASGVVDSVKAGAPFRLAVQRIGALNIIEVNGVRVIAYPDTSPLFGTYTSHLYLYFWRKTMLLKQLAISARPSALDMDKISSEQLVAFVTTPEKLYRFRSEPIRYINMLMYAITFEHIPVLLLENRKGAAITLIEEAREYIQKNYFRKIDFMNLARQCNISYKLFTKKFNDLYKLTPKAYQMEWKLKEARILLKSGKYKVQEVGEMVGFEDTPNFHHLFKKKFGKAPGVWAGE